MHTLTPVDANALHQLQSREQFSRLGLDDPDAKAIDALGDILGLRELAFEERPEADAYGVDIGGLLISCCVIVVWLIRSGLYHGPKP